MRENQLLSDQRPVKQGARRKHNGTIITKKTNVLLETDEKKLLNKKGFTAYFPLLTNITMKYFPIISVQLFYCYGIPVK